MVQKKFFKDLSKLINESTPLHYDPHSSDHFAKNYEEISTEEPILPNELSHDKVARHTSFSSCFDSQEELIFLSDLTKNEVISNIFLLIIFF